MSEKMKLNDFAAPIKAKNNFIKASFGGFAGSGKTRTACEFIIGAYKELKCSKPILIIDNEKGSRFLIPFFEKAGIKVLLKDTIELADTLQAFEYLNSDEIDFLFIDSLTKIWYKYVDDYKTKNRRVFMTLQDWGKILPSWQNSFANKFVNIEGSCVFTGRGGYTYDMEENEKGKKEFVKSGIKMKMAGETPFEPDLNIWMEIAQEIKNNKPVITREGLVMKDRSGLIDGKTFINPSYNDFKPVVEYLVAVPKGEVKGGSNQSNLAPSESTEHYERRDQINIEIEKIKNLFDEFRIGSSADDKELKVKITKKFFGTSSGKEFEKLSHTRLKSGRENMEQFFNDLDILIPHSEKLTFLESWKPKDELRV